MIFTKNMTDKQINFHNFRQQLFFEFDTITTNHNLFVLHSYQFH